jgi:Protein of unknown function (DUF1553)/Protein of unknown function (DUF1549)/Planctomycete cytochrome C
MKISICLAMASALIVSIGSTSLADDAGTFDRSVAPILVRRCLDCHSGGDPKGKLDLSRRAQAIQGGKGGPAVVPGKPEESSLWERVESGEMPPKVALPAEEKRLIRDWIASGAGWGTDPIDPYQATSSRRGGRDWWSLQPVRRVEPPQVTRKDWPRTPIDRFVLRKLEAEGLAPRPEADRRTLIRRLRFDLTGLPPTPEEVDDFLNDGSPDAYDRLVDRLLGSPDHGVRWARWWLDLARFGESNGFEHDEFRPGAYRYRDWVVGALNRDLPYDEFACLQLAGDVLKPNDPQAIEASGFLVAGAFDAVGQNQVSQVMKAVVRGDELEDIIGTVGQTFLGLTVNCARCHDHKFDPIRQTEYYRFASSLDGVRQGERDLSSLAPEAITGKGRKAYVVKPREPGVMKVQLRGNPAEPGEVVSAGGIASLASTSADFGLPPDAPEGERRKRLAHWIADPRNPLFSRVVVNRLWQAHFGVGLVETPSDLGFSGGVPSNPELLDWLASELVAKGWSLKAIHRLIVTSAAYRQASTLDPGGMAKDSGDRTLWRKAPMRLEAEMVRDAMLAISGRLDKTLGGPSFFDQTVTRASGTNIETHVEVDPSKPGLGRRTLYRAWVRGGRSGLLDAFDCPDPSTTAPRRAVTTTPIQALALMNNSLVLYLSDTFADRLAREAGPDAGSQVDRAFRLAFGRKPDVEERDRALKLVEKFGASTLARVLFNSNEFLYVD